jgi:hypothetical protein
MTFHSLISHSFKYYRRARWEIETNLLNEFAACGNEIRLVKSAFADSALPAEAHLVSIKEMPVS